jgi:hypothetical protein
MPKHKTKHAGNGQHEPHREVVIDDSLPVALNMLEPAERGAVEAVIRSPERLEELAPTAYRGGTNGQFYIADASPQMKVVFRLTPKTVEVLQLMSKRAFDQLLAPQADE